MTAAVSAACPRVAATTIPMTTPSATYASSSTTMAYAAGRTDSWNRSSRGGSGAERDTSSARTRIPASHSRPKKTVDVMSVSKPTSADVPRKSPTSPRGMSNVCRAPSETPMSAASHSTAIRAAQPASSLAPATARCRSGHRNPAAITSAPARATDSGITVSPACVSAMAPAPPDSSTVPPTAVTTVAATTRQNASSGRSVAPAAHRPSAATTTIATSPARTVPRAWSQPCRAVARSGTVRGERRV
jgi:hypothetical protein